VCARLAWDEPGPPQPPRRVWRDWALVGVFGLAAVLEGTLRTDVPWRGLAVAIGVGLVPTLLWRRTRPLLMVGLAFGTGSVASVTTTGPPPRLDSSVYLLFLSYALGRWGTGRALAGGLAVMTGACVLSVFVDPVSPTDTGAGLALLVAAAAVGAMFRFRAAARLRAHEKVALLERERLARDLHDTVAHHVSAIAVRAQAGLATAPTDPAAAAAALELIEAEARRALAEMRAMVRVLRDGPDHDAARPAPEDLTPNPGITDLAALARRDGDAGPSVQVRISGDVSTLAPSVAAALYRLAQEAVTNARRHARHATRIVVDLAADDSAVRLRIDDDGDPVGTRPTTSPGYGLRGMRERAQLLGGTFEAGPAGGSRGWTVTAVLPRGGSALGQSV
jgi:signal transduction histidine kinase